MIKMTIKMKKMIKIIIMMMKRVKVIMNMRVMMIANIRVNKGSDNENENSVY